MRRISIMMTLVLASTIVLGGSGRDSAWAGEARVAPPGYVAGAPAPVTIRDLAFSESVDDDARPRDPKVEFDTHTEHVWVSFSYGEYGGERMSFIARADGEDWKWSDLDCCQRGSGRFAFALERRGHHDLGGAAYEVRIYAGDAEVAQGGFGVRGRQGFDNDNE